MSNRPNTGPSAVKKKNKKKYTNAGRKTEDLKKKKKTLATVSYRPRTIRSRVRQHKFCIVL